MAKRTVTGVGTESYQENSGTVCGFLVSATATTASDITIAQMEAVNISVQYYSGISNTPDTVMSGNAFALVAATNPGSYGSAALVTGTAGFGGEISFGGYINLKDGDRLNINIQVGGSPATGAQFTLTTLYGIGVQVYTPVVTVFSPTKTRTDEPFNLGDNVTTISIINSATDHVITSVSVNSDKWQASYNESDLSSLMASQWERSPEYWGYNLHNGFELDSVMISATVDTGASGNCYVVSFGGKVTPKLSQRSAGILTKIADRNWRKYFGQAR